MSADSVTIIPNKLYGPQHCPECGAGPYQLEVATTESHQTAPTKQNPRPSVRFIGYNCTVCGEKLRFTTETTK